MSYRGAAHTMVVVAVLCLSKVGVAQTSWDPIAFEELVNEGNQLRQQADELSGVDREAHHQHLYEAALAKQQASEMLRRALLTGDFGEAPEEEREQLLTLSEERVSVLIELQQCIAARVVLEQALYGQTLLPEEGADRLSVLESSIDLCDVRVFDSPVGWDEARFEAYLAQSNVLAAEADSLAQDQEHERLSLLFEQAQLQQEALSLLQNAMVLGRVRSERIPELSSQLFTLYEGILPNLADLELCDAVEALIQRAHDHSDLLPEGSAEELETLGAQLDSCQHGPSEPSVPADPSVSTPPIEEPAGFGEALPYILFGAAAATGLSAIFIDISYAGERDDLELLQQLCTTGPCNREQADTLANTIDTGKIVIGTLAGVAVVTGVTGLILLLTGDDDSTDPPIEVDATVSGDGVGAIINMTF